MNNSKSGTAFVSKINHDQLSHNKGFYVFLVIFSIMALIVVILLISLMDMI